MTKTTTILFVTLALMTGCTPKAETPPVEESSSSNKSLADKMKEKTDESWDEKSGSGTGGGSVDPEERTAALDKLQKTTALDLAEDCHEFSDFKGKTSPFRFINTRVDWYTANGKTAPGSGAEQGGNATCSSTCGGSWRLFTEKEVEAYTVPIDVIVGGKLVESGYGMDSWTSTVAFGGESDSETERLSSAYSFSFSYFKQKTSTTNPESLKYLLCRKS